MSKLVYVLNGPNLNLLGVREPDLYGHDTQEDLEALCRRTCDRHGLDIAFHQSNAEHDLVDWIQETRGRAVGLVINPAGFCYYSVAILDALRMCDCPVIEVHISHLYTRSPEWRSKTITAAASHALISGMGIHGYALAIEHLAHGLNIAD